MPVTIGGGLSLPDRELAPEELDLIRQITREFSTLARTELAHTICQLLQWRRPNGGLKSRECYFFLQALHAHGWLLWLPPPQLRTRRPPITVFDPQTAAQTPLPGGLRPVSSPALAIARKSLPATPLAALYPALSLSRLPRALWRAA